MPKFFSQIPSRSFDVRLLKVKIPNNYDPILHSYGRSDSQDGFILLPLLKELIFGMVNLQKN